MRAWAIVVLVASGSSTAQSRKPVHLEPGTAGVFYVKKSDASVYEVEIVFPQTELTEGPALSISLYDEQGLIAVVEPSLAKAVTSQGWCFNDGGDQSRPTIKAKLPVTAFKRAPQARSALQNLAGFALVGKGVKPPKLELGPDVKDLRLKVKLDTSGSQLAIGVYDSFDCDGAPKNSLGIDLEVGSESRALRCCGP